MRGRVALGAVAVAVLIAGCGSSGSGAPANPLASELSDYPATAPLVLTVQTNPNSSAIQQTEALIGRFPIAGLGIAALKSKISSFGFNYDSDIKPLLGNPIAIGFGTLSGAGSAAFSRQVLLVFVTKGGSALGNFVAKLTSGTKSIGSRDGAKLYGQGGYELAVDGPTLILGTPSTLPAALDRHAHGGGLTEAQLQSDTTGLPQDSLIEAVGNLAGVLPASARSVPWVAAIRGYGATIGASSAGIDIDFRVDTSGAALASQQVPLASGSTPPQLAGAVPIQVGVRDPAQTLSFVEQADPHAFAGLAPRKKAEIAGLIKLLSGDAIVGGGNGMTIFRATVSNPGKAAKLLASAGDLKPVGGGFYSKPHRLFAIIDNEYVVGTNASRAQMRAFAGAPTAPASFAHGALAFRIGLLSLLHVTLSSSSTAALLAPLLNALGDLTGWASATPGALTGSATIAIK
jgi:hypothetical protein